MIEFNKQEFTTTFSDAAGNPLVRIQQVRTDPVTMRQCRITPSRALEHERGTEKLHQPPEIDLDESTCPFCAANLESMTPCLNERISSRKRLQHGNSILFPNLFPYTEWSAVSLFDSSHHVEIGTARPHTYRDSFINCSDYLTRVKRADPEAMFMSITQNHLPGAGGSLVHPHLQVHAARQVSNNHAVLKKRAGEHAARYGSCIFSDLLLAEKQIGERYIGSTGTWEWLAAYAPSGFYEIWGIAASQYSLLIPEKQEIWQDLAEGVLNTQRFYRSLNRNAYNLNLLSVEDDTGIPCLKIALTARSSYAPWVRSDYTGFELASGEMATFTLPESVAAMAEKFWKRSQAGQPFQSE
ncbi:MAG: galactose-1-phosphate uridylyltransferase [Desulfofustis sp.]|nr:galactose-1-phosphate uridylyltransferase [Desulfofustis sp.]